MKKFVSYLSFVLLFVTSAAPAHENLASRADGHAPIGVMGDHMHKSGEWMLSYRAMTMSMSGNLKGEDSISDTELVTGEPNRFAGMPMMPPTLRVAPQDMTTTMHMVGVMYAPNDKVALMAMFNYLDKSMTLSTYQGMMGSNVLGSFETRSRGLGDTRVSALYRLYDAEHHKLHLNLGLSVPTGSIDETDQLLTPMNMRPTRRLPYGMQLGSGTWDWMPGITYNGRHLNWSWGAQYLATLRTSNNEEGYRLGDEHALSGWLQYALTRGLSVGSVVRYQHSDKIDGLDDEIMLPVQTADPDNYGRRQASISASANWAVQSGPLKNHRFAVEYLVPVKQDVNGIQMEMDRMWTLGYQKAF